MLLSQALADKLAEWGSLQRDAAGEYQALPVAGGANPAGAAGVIVGHPFERGPEEVAYVQVLLARIRNRAVLTHGAEIECRVHAQVGSRHPVGLLDDIIPCKCQSSLFTLLGSADRCYGFNSHRTLSPIGIAVL